MAFSKRFIYETGANWAYLQCGNYLPEPTDAEVQSFIDIIGCRWGINIDSDGILWRLGDDSYTRKYKRDLRKESVWRVANGLALFADLIGKRDYRDWARNGIWLGSYGLKHRMEAMFEIRYAKHPEYRYVAPGEFIAGFIYFMTKYAGAPDKVLYWGSLIKAPEGVANAFIKMPRIFNKVAYLRMFGGCGL